MKQIQTKLSIQESSSNWRSHLAIYSPSLGRVVTESDAGFYSPKELAEDVKPGWQVTPYDEGAIGVSCLSGIRWHRIPPSIIQASQIP